MTKKHDQRESDQMNDWINTALDTAHTLGKLTERERVIKLIRIADAQQDNHSDCPMCMLIETVGQGDNNE
jgi:hypothetical protein